VAEKALLHGRSSARALICYSRHDDVVLFEGGRERSRNLAEDLAALWAPPSSTT